MDTRSKEAKVIVYTAIMTALVFTATMIAMEIPATGGYFNLGETMVYTSAIIGGPVVGAISGGVGSALADIYSGYGVYAPGTLVIKGLEGFIVGEIFRRLASKKDAWFKNYMIPITLVLALLLFVIGYKYFTGNATFYIFSKEITFYVGTPFWVLVAVLIAIPAVYYYTRNDTEGFSIVYSIIPGGLLMIAGYYLYEITIIGLKPQQAAVEVPFNFGQMLIGLFVSLYLARALREAGVKV